MSLQIFNLSFSWRRTEFSKLISCWFMLLLLYSEVVEYSLTKLLEKLQISHEEVRLKPLKMSLKAHNSNTYFTIHNTTSHKYSERVLKLSLFCNFLPPVCWLVHFVGLWLLWQDSRFGSKESSDIDPEAPNYWKCGFAYQQKGTSWTTSGLCLSFCFHSASQKKCKTW